MIHCVTEELCGESFSDLTSLQLRTRRDAVQLPAPARHADAGHRHELLGADTGVLMLPAPVIEIRSRVSRVEGQTLQRWRCFARAARSRLTAVSFLQVAASHDRNDVARRRSCRAVAYCGAGA